MKAEQTPLPADVDREHDNLPPTAWRAEDMPKQRDKGSGGGTPIQRLNPYLIQEVRDHPITDPLKTVATFDDATEIERILTELKYDAEASLRMLVGVATGADTLPRDRLAADQAIDRRRLHALRMSGRLASVTATITEEVTGGSVEDIRRLTKTIQASWNTTGDKINAPSQTIQASDVPDDITPDGFPDEWDVGDGSDYDADDPPDDGPTGD